MNSSEDGWNSSGDSIPSLGCLVKVPGDPASRGSAAARRGIEEFKGLPASRGCAAARWNPEGAGRPQTASRGNAAARCEWQKTRHPAKPTDRKVDGHVRLHNMHEQSTTEMEEKDEEVIDQKTTEANLTDWIQAGIDRKKRKDEQKEKRKLNRMINKKVTDARIPEVPKVPENMTRVRHSRGKKLVDGVQQQVHGCGLQVRER